MCGAGGREVSGRRALAGKDPEMLSGKAPPPLCIQLCQLCVGLHFIENPKVIISVRLRLPAE